MKWFYKAAYYNTKTQRWIKRHNQKHFCIGIDKKQLEENKRYTDRFGRGFSEVCGYWFHWWKPQYVQNVIYVQQGDDGTIIAIEIA